MTPAHIPPTGFHKHRCKLCGYVWQHETLDLPMAGSHDCPRCKTPQLFQYEGPTPPGAFAPDPDVEAAVAALNQAGR